MYSESLAKYIITHYSYIECVLLEMNLFFVFCFILLQCHYKYLKGQIWLNLLSGMQHCKGGPISIFIVVTS